MAIKITHTKSLILFCCLSASCYDASHKNNNTQLQSASPGASEQAMSPSKTIAENLLADSSYSILSSSFSETNLFDILANPGPFTVFAPVNAAFRDLPNGTLESLLKERKNDLTNILSHHIVAGVLLRKDLEKEEKIKTLAGEELIVTKMNDEFLINGVRIKSREIKSKNGIVYVIDGLLFPISQNPGAY